jgi:aconitate hydratase 2/2-methylisocitrate dehydratase
VLDSYYKQAKEREQIGVVPKPLSASDVEELIAVLQDPGAESREELLNLIENRIPPGVDEAAKVKAAFLNDLATGRKTSPVLSKQKAVELLGTMQGGYNVQYLLDLLKD